MRVPMFPVLLAMLAACTSDADKDGLVGAEDCDDGDALVGAPATWYPDEDGDGIGADGGSTDACSAPSGFVGANGDCDDEDATVRPGVAEACNARDDNCDGVVDEQAPGSLWYADADGDGYGNPAQAYDLCVPEAGLVADGTDCNDTSDGSWPGADELCDGLDNDCDGRVDDDAAGSSTYWADADGDGFGAGAPVTSCAPPDGHVDLDGDCDDGASGVFPGADESCNGVDEDCDGEIDDAAVDGTTWYVDADGDSYGADDSGFVTCARPDGAATRGGDCDDADPAQNPETWWYADADGDGYGDARGKAVQQCLGFAGSARADGDCADDDASRHPAAVETCDGVDEDCDGGIDDGAGDASPWYGDGDGDGYGNEDVAVSSCTSPGAGFVAVGGDCDDESSASNPLAEEVCDDVDNDCDLLTDLDDPSLVGIPTWYLDADRDGYGTFDVQIVTCDVPAGYVADGSDCRDDQPNIHAYAVELCNGYDDDCDVLVDGADAIDAVAWYADVDLDGWGDDLTAVWSCDAPDGLVPAGQDCDDADPEVHPLAAEDCLATEDRNCDGSFGDADIDGDGVIACLDCDDAEPAAWPGAAEVCDAVDNDCNGIVDDDGAGGLPWRWYLDGDADGVGLSYAWVDDCSGAPDGYASSAGDCADDDATVHPGAVEVCDLQDNDCDGVVPIAEVDDDFDGQTPVACGGSDCDDADPETYLGAEDVCSDGIDNDCDGVDCEDWRDDFESGLDPAWVNGSAVPWLATSAESYAGAWSGASGNISDGGRTTLEVTLTYPADGAMSFAYKVSSESGYDYLTFKRDGTTVQRWSGTIAWAVYSSAVTAGTHTFTWEYGKDGSVSSGSDTVWIDDVVATGGTP